MRSEGLGLLVVVAIFLIVAGVILRLGVGGIVSGKIRTMGGRYARPRHLQGREAKVTGIWYVFGGLAVLMFALILLKLSYPILY